MRVVCVKYGSKYSDLWVKRLWKMVARHLPIPHEFVCVTEKPVEGIKCIPLLCEYPGWWQKVGLFQLDGDNLYLDLDVVINDSLLPLVALLYKSPGLWARDDFSYSMRNPRQGLDEQFKKLLGGDGCVNSSVMLWHGGVARDVWEKFNPKIMDVMHGDQNHISNVMRDRIQFIPDEMIQSYKYHVMQGASLAPITVFHGNPKADELHHLDPLRVAWET